MDPTVLEEASSSAIHGVGRAIDRHNPIIRDEKRLGQPHIILPSTSTFNHHQNKNPNKSGKKNQSPATETGDQKRKSIEFAAAPADDDDEVINIENITKQRDFISPEASSRCLLSDRAVFSFSPEFHHFPATPPHEPLIKFQNSMALKKKDDDIVFYAPPKSPPSPPCEPVKLHHSKGLKKKDGGLLSFSSPKPEPPPSPGLREALEKKDDDSVSYASPAPSPPLSDQVVVLEVSLHCRGCERKMRKHISKIEGVRSFKIEFDAKKVTVVGDVTPLAVLTSVLKVKNAKLLTPVTISSSIEHPLTDSDFYEIKKRLEIVK